MIALALAMALQQQADSAEALRTLNEQILAADGEKQAALIKGLALPDSAAWFKKTFGDEVGAKLDAEYQGLLKDLEGGLAKLYAKCKADGQTAVRAIRLEKAGPEATGLQNSAFEAMKTPAVLYTVKLTKPDEKLGMSLWSFAHVDGAFRLVGKMRAVKP